MVRLVIPILFRLKYSFKVLLFIYSLLNLIYSYMFLTLINSWYVRSLCGCLLFYCLLVYFMCWFIDLFIECGIIAINYHACCLFYWKIYLIISVDCRYYLPILFNFKLRIIYSFRQTYRHTDRQTERMKTRKGMEEIDSYIIDSLRPVNHEGYIKVTQKLSKNKRRQKKDGRKKDRK